MDKVSPVQPPIRQLEKVDNPNSEQKDLARECKFYDDLPFNITSKTTAEDVSGGEDFNEPVVHSESTDAIAVEGLNYVGGLDISFVAGEDVTSGNKEGHAGLPDAYATIAVLEYPSLKVSTSSAVPGHFERY